MPAIVVPVLVNPGALTPLDSKCALRLHKSKLNAPSGTVMKKFNNQRQWYGFVRLDSVHRLRKVLDPDEAQPTVECNVSVHAERHRLET